MQQRQAVVSDGLGSEQGQRRQHKVQCQAEHVCTAPPWDQCRRKTLCKEERLGISSISFIHAEPYIRAMQNKMSFRVVARCLL